MDLQIKPSIVRIFKEGGTDVAGAGFFVSQNYIDVCPCNCLCFESRIKQMN